MLWFFWITTVILSSLALRVGEIWWSNVTSDPYFWHFLAVAMIMFIASLKPIQRR